MSRLAHPDAPLQFTQVQRALTQRPFSPPSWISYGGGEAIFLTIALLVVACGFVYAGKRLHTPLRIAPPGSSVAWLLIAIWTLAVCTLGVAWSVYELQLKEAYPSFVEPRVRVHIFTIIDAVAAFFAIFYLTRRWGWNVALHSAVIGTAAAWTIFEFPFDLIVMMRINPPVKTVMSPEGLTRTFALSNRPPRAPSWRATREGARPQASIYVTSPMPRSLPRAAASSHRAGKLDQRETSSAFAKVAW